MPTRPAERRRPEASWQAVTVREVEVLRLVAEGLSNRKLARRLVISPRTAEHHVPHIYAKIGVSSRAAAALFGLEQLRCRDGRDKADRTSAGRLLNLAQASGLDVVDEAADVFLLG